MAYYIEFQKDIDYIVIILLIIILFLSLIFNEIIEINVCGLSDNTKRNIVTRSNTELFIKCESIDDNESEDN